MMDAWFDTRLVIIDEVSFACGVDITKIQKTLWPSYIMKLTFEKYGRLNVVLQEIFHTAWEPVAHTPLYEEQETPAFHHYMNSFIELSGHHRFKDNPPWGLMMQRFREGEPTLEKTLLAEWVLSIQDLVSSSS
jgi:hypothetical protein